MSADAVALLDGPSPVGAIAEAVRSRRISAAAVLETTLARIGERNGIYNAFTDVIAERARAAAAAVDAAVVAGHDPGTLAGVPFAVKNLVDLAGLPTRAGSKINRAHPPKTRDGAVVRRLIAAGAVPVGALNMGEYAYDFTGENAHDGPSRNPHDPSRMTGGSSGGCGAAVAGGLVPLAIGSDTNGSIRVPASLCGVFGLKPTYGRISRAGSFLFVASLDHLGPLARSTVDLALALDATAGHDPDDPVSMESDHAPLVRTALEEGAHGLRIARLGGYFERQGEPEAFDAVERVCRALDVTRRVEMPEVERARAAAFLISATEGGNLHLPRLRAQAADYDPDTRDRFIAGALAPAAWYVQAQRFRRWFRKRVLELFETVDVLIAPATPVTAPGLGQKTICVAGSEIPVRANLGIFTQPLSFVGLPVVTVPLQRRGALPIGVQIVAAPWREDRILRVAMALEARRVVAAWQVSFKG